MTLKSENHFIDDPFVAAEDIGWLLFNGSLALFLGAGVSRGFGLPDWPNLVARLLKRDTDKKFVRELAGMSDAAIAKLVEDVDTNDANYHELVHRALYRDVKKSVRKEFMVSPLLLAISALVTGGLRGRIGSVFTYNYDDLMEQYLRMIGVVAWRRTAYTDVVGRCDVQVNHVHGYLPQDWRRSDWRKTHDLVLSESSYRRRRATIDAGWASIVQSTLQSHIGLFVGLSGNDSSLLDVLERSHAKREYPFSGYWLLSESAFKENAKSIRKVGMCPIKLRTEDLPRFLAQVCEEAAPPGQDQ